MTKLGLQSEPVFYPSILIFADKIPCQSRSIDSQVKPNCATNHHHDSKGGSSGKVDSAEFLSAVGTFFATLTAFVSVIVIVLREDPHIYWIMMTMLGWVVGVLMQIIAGGIARTRA